MRRCLSCGLVSVAVFVVVRRCDPGQNMWEDFKLAAEFVCLCREQAKDNQCRVFVLARTSFNPFELPHGLLRTCFLGSEEKRVVGWNHRYMNCTYAAP